MSMHSPGPSYSPNRSLTPLLCSPMPCSSMPCSPMPCTQLLPDPTPRQHTPLTPLLVNAPPTLLATPRCARARFPKVRTVAASKALRPGALPIAQDPLHPHLEARFRSYPAPTPLLATSTPPPPRPSPQPVPPLFIPHLIIIPPPTASPGRSPG